MASEDDVLLAVIENPDAGPDDVDSYRLWEHVRSTGSLDPVDRLLERGDTRLAQIAAWILSEMGSDASGSSAFEPLLRWDDTSVRFWATDAVIACAPNLPSTTVAQAMNGIADREDLVRVAAAHLVAASSTDVIERAIEFVDEDTRLLLGWLIDVEGSLTTEQVQLKVLDAEPKVRIMAAVAAARMPDPHSELAQLADLDLDPDVRSVLNRLLLVRDAW